MKSVKFHVTIPFFLIIILLVSGLSACCPRNIIHSATPDTSDRSAMMAASDDSAAVSKELSFDDYTNLLFTQNIQKDTLSLHYTLSDPAAHGITNYVVALPDYSKNAASLEALHTENMASALSSYSYDSLETDEQLTYDILTDYTNSCVRNRDLYLYQEILRPSTGFPAQLPVLLSEYYFYNRQDVEDYLMLLTKIPDCFTSVCSFEEAKSEAGLFMPDTQADKLIADIDTFCDTAKEHYLITTFRNKINALTGLTPEEKEEYCRQNEELFQSCVLPSYEEISQTLTSLKGSGTNDAGLCYYPNGLDYYTQLVYNSTGSLRSIDELLEMTEAQRTEDMLAIASIAKKYPEISLSVSDYPLAAASPEEILNYLTTAVTDRFPAPSATEFSVNYVDACMQESMAPAFYLTAPMDNLAHNVIYINPAGNIEGVELFTTLAHEGFPGHLYQTTATASANLPPIRSLMNYPGYTEGWATYVEMLSYSYLGLPKEQALLLMHNQSALLSLYATADLSIHGKGWTLSDLSKFFTAYGIRSEKTVSDIYHYIVSEPAHYLKYYIGYPEFLDLKEDAMEALDNRFNERKFHEQILKIGPAPFEILRKYLFAETS